MYYHVRFFGHHIPNFGTYLSSFLFIGRKLPTLEMIVVYELREFWIGDSYQAIIILKYTLRLIKATSNVNCILSDSYFYSIWNSGLVSLKAPEGSSPPADTLKTGFAHPTGPKKSVMWHIKKMRVFSLFSVQ